MESRRKVAALLYCVTASCYAAVASEEIEVDHGIVDDFAFQEALLIEAAFGIVLLTMIWVGFLQSENGSPAARADRTARRSIWRSNRARRSTIESC
jgi:hypothetical protein